MAAPTKYLDSANVLQRRVDSGDYLLHDLPGVRRIAEDLGVSYVTARKAVLELVSRQVLIQRGNGTFEVNQAYLRRQTAIQAGLVFPAHPATHFMHLQRAVAFAAEVAGIGMRPVQYVHWDDPVIVDALQGCDGTIVIPSTEPMPTRIVELFAEPAHRVVLMDGDLTHSGVPSIQLFPQGHILELFEHLALLGHRRVDCLNVQGHNAEIQRRIDLWRRQLDTGAMSGTLWDDPVRPYQSQLPRAHALAQRMLGAPSFHATAVVCTTMPAAQALLRACYERGVTVGRDLSVCTINNEPTGRYLCPSLTGLEMPNLTAAIRRAFDWFGQAGDWAGPLLLTPDRAELLAGESTGPAEPRSCSSTTRSWSAS